MMLKIISLIKIISYEIDSYYYKKKLKVTNIDLSFPLFIRDINNIEIGENCAINAFVHIWSNAKVRIGDNTIIASHVQITTSTHDYNIMPFRDFRKDLPVTIGKNVWIGSGAIIFPGVEIGDNVVIGAGAVVTKSIPANVVAYGVPAMVVKNLGKNKDE